MYSEDNYLMLSGLQHFVFCRRQWALIHIEQQWADNLRTADGEIMHKNVHNPDFREVRGDVITVRAMAVSSSRLGISGECDAVEFRKDSSGVALSGLEGRYSVTPVEYKRGSPKEDERDTVQLAAQAMCLEEMLCCTVPWQKRKDDIIRHPFLEESMEWGILPYAQALLLARFIRGDLDAYPPFMWK